MKRKLIVMPLVLLIICFLSAGTAQADGPVSISVFNPVQIINEYENVKGVRLNLIYGVNYDVSGLDLGLVNKVDGDQKGVQVGIYNSAAECTGVQIGLINRTEWLNGVQIGLINIHVEGERSFFPLVNFSF